MFYHRYKYFHQFYLSSELYSLILEKNNEVTIKNIRTFFKERIFINYRIKVTKVNNLLYLITVRFKLENDKVEFLEYLSDYKELFPPWIVFPNYLNQSISWDQGAEYDYCILNWCKFWKKLTIQQKEQYLIKYKCPKDWSDWLEEYLM